jgi:hypothetical protein
MDRRGWTEKSIRKTIDDRFTTRPTTIRETGNPGTAYYNEDGTYVVVDDVTGKVTQIQDRFDPTWKPDPNTIDPYIPVTCPPKTSPVFMLDWRIRKRG